MTVVSAGPWNVLCPLQASDQYRAGRPYQSPRGLVCQCGRAGYPDVWPTRPVLCDVRVPPGPETAGRRNDIRNIYNVAPVMFKSRAGLKSLSRQCSKYSLFRKPGAVSCERLLACFCVRHCTATALGPCCLDRPATTAEAAALPFPWDCDWISVRAAHLISTPPALPPPPPPPPPPREEDGNRPQCCRGRTL